MGALGSNMIKYLIPLVIVVLAVLAALWYKDKARHFEELYTNSQANNELLIKHIRKVYDDKLQTEKRNRELEQAALQDKAVFDWYSDISNSSVVKQLQAD